MRVIAGVLLLVLGGACQPNVLGKLSSGSTGDLGLGAAPRGRFDAAATAACGPAGEVSALRRAPYLQRVSSTSADVLWTGENLGAPTVRLISPDGGPPREIAAGVDRSAVLPVGQQWVARAEGLEPGATYCYEVRDRGAVLAGRAALRTAPGTDSTVRFVALGDVGSGGVDQLAVLDQLKQSEADLALITGDVGLPHGRLEDYEQNLFARYSDLMRVIPFFPTSGNHDYDTPDAVVFRQVFDLFENGGVAGRERWYSLNWGPLHVVALDTEEASAEQAAWLDADLQRNERPFVIVIQHVPAYSSGYQGPEPAVQQHFIPVYVKHRVDLVLCGHDHDYERTKPIDGVTYIVTGGGGSGTRPVGHSDFTAFSQQVAHHLYAVADRHQLRIWAIDATGRTFDTVKLQARRCVPRAQ